MSLEEEGTYTRVNSVNTIFSLYVHQHPGNGHLLGKGGGGRGGGGGGGGV